MTFESIDELGLTQVQSNKLSIILSRLELGNNTVFITPVGERVGPDVLFDEWSKIFNRYSSKMNHVLIDIEINQKEKQGPRSIAKPWKDIEEEVLSTFDNVYNECSHIPSVPLKSYDRSILRPLSTENAIKLLRLSTSSGLPDLSKKGTVIKTATLLTLGEEYHMNYPMVPFVRTQEQGKTRVIMGYPISDIIQETRYFEPLFQYYSKQDHFAAMRSPDDVNTAMTSLISETVRLGQKCVSGDISGFDRDFGKALQTKVFDEMSYLIQDEYLPLFKEIADRFGSKGLVVPYTIINGEHGIPSGSRGTNLVGSVA
jgi:hypothetical protein